MKYEGGERTETSLSFPGEVRRYSQQEPVAPNGHRARQGWVEFGKVGVKIFDRTRDRPPESRKFKIGILT